MGDLVLRGLVRTMDPAEPVTDAVAVRAGRIVATGDDAKALVGTGTDVVDVGADGCVLPGFQDAHAHPVLGGLRRMECDLGDVHSLPEYLDVIAGYVSANPDAEWVTGGGWYGDVFPGGFPTSADLDRAVGDRPAVLASHDGHGAWVSSAALRRAGIDDDTPDPPDGRIMRDADGEATGMLVEGAADLVGDLVPAPDEERLRQAILRAQQYLHGLGITAWQDAAVGEALGLPDCLPAYLSLTENDLLTARVTGALWWRRDGSLDQVPELAKRRDASSRGRFTASAVKIMLDGVCENLTAAVLEPYRGTHDERGIGFLAPEQLREAVVALDAEGFDLHVHAVGDRAVRDCLDAFAAARVAGGPRDRRHQIAHLDLVDAYDVARMRDLDVIANVQPLWARNDPVLVETKLPYLTEAQRRAHFAFGSMARAGVPLAMGSDWPVSSPDPLWGIHVAVTRTAPADDPHAQDERAQRDPLLADEALPVDAAVAAYTRGAARANRLDHETGTVTVGGEADLVVLDRDPYGVDPREIADIDVVTTIAGGRVVHEAEA